MCKFHKFGFCKFREVCKRTHLTQICESQLECKDTKQCRKRHPKSCKRYNSGNGCKYGEECAYNHKVDEKDKEVKELKEEVIELKEIINHLKNTVEELINKVEGMNVDKLEQIDNVVRALVRKVLSLESNLEEMKMKKEIGGLGTTKNKLKIKEMETEIFELKENCSMNKVSFHNNDIENSCSTPKKNKYTEKEELPKEELLTCSKCSYTCKKGNTLKKHMLNKHEGHQCKECNKKLSTIVDLLKHVSTYHYQEQNDVQEENTEDGKVKLSEIVEEEVSSSVFDESQIYCELCSIKCKNKKALEAYEQ